ncbi:MAG TPA: aminoglycoside phosphotransferase family protein [Solirubrobacterales bacterium]|jgi:aminoglycoside phosphotransferase (APT) family kinase protein|nr:aminoglycoside phosphotransferase family protein [Solirubrobacterales bacterium]
MSAPSDAELRTGLERALVGAGLELAGAVERRPSSYRTSFPIEELRFEVTERGEVRAGFKQLEWDRLEPGAQLAKPRFLHDPEREPEVYRALLPQAPAGPPEFFGSVLEAGRCWLFVEWVEGRELFQVGERELWEEAARWLARFHVAMAPEWERHRREARLLDHDAAFYRRWTERAREFAADPKRIEWLAARHERVVEALLAMPRTVVHGEFYASNVLVASDFEHTSVGRKPDTRVAPVDWELTAVGTGLSDLAALVSGWPEGDREAIAAAYAAESGVPSFSRRDLDLARLQAAIQWLGWAPPAWEPPEGQRHDWLGEAVALAEGLEL